MFEIHWDRKTAKQVYDQYRALGDIAKLYSFWQNTNEKVKMIDILPPNREDDFTFDNKYPNSEPGQVVTFKIGKKLFLAIFGGFWLFLAIFGEV